MLHSRPVPVRPQRAIDEERDGLRERAISAMCRCDGSLERRGPRVDNSID